MTQDLERETGRREMDVQMKEIVKKMQEMEKKMGEMKKEMEAKNKKIEEMKKEIDVLNAELLERKTNGCLVCNGNDATAVSHSNFCSNCSTLFIDMVLVSLFSFQN